VKYFFQPGQKLICQRHKRPARDFGLLSYFARNVQLPQLLSVMDNLLSYSAYPAVRPFKTGINFIVRGPIAERTEK